MLSLHINVKELRVVHLICQAFLSHVTGKSVLVLMDNTAAMFNLNRGAHSSPMCQEALQLWEFCIIHLVHLKASDLLGVQKRQADHLSRSFSSHHEWSLPLDIRRDVFEQSGTP